MGRYGSVGVLMLAGLSFLRADVAWAYLAAVLAFEAWLAARMAALGRHPADTGTPYYFTDEEARLVGRFRFFFTETGKVRQFGSVLAAIGLTALILSPWLALKHAFVPAALVGANVIAVAFLTRRLIPTVDTGAVWDKIRGGNAPAP
jgi:hypothetical protein